MRWMVPVLMGVTAVCAVVFSFPFSEESSLLQREGGGESDGKTGLRWAEQESRESEERVMKSLAELEAEMEENRARLKKSALLRKERIKFGADEITRDEEAGFLMLEGHAWWRLDDRILAGQHNPRSRIVLDLETYGVVKSFGAAESLLIR